MLVYIKNAQKHNVPYSAVGALPFATVAQVPDNVKKIILPEPIDGIGVDAIWYKVVSAKYNAVGTVVEDKFQPLLSDVLHGRWINEKAGIWKLDEQSAILMYTSETSRIRKVLNVSDRKKFKFVNFNIEVPHSVLL